VPFNFCLISAFFMAVTWLFRSRTFPFLPVYASRPQLGSAAASALHTHRPIFSAVCGLNCLPACPTILPPCLGHSPRDQVKVRRWENVAFLSVCLALFTTILHASKLFFASGHLLRAVTPFWSTSQLKCSFLLQTFVNYCVLFSLPPGHSSPRL
jgi:hypothetical protein